MQPLRHRTDRAHDFGLLDVKVALHRASRHVAGQHDKRRPALRRLADPGQRIGQPRTGMHAHQCQLAGRLGIGIAHARCVAFVARGNQLDTGLDQRMRNLEIGGAEQAEAAACAVRGEVPGDDCRDCWRAITAGQIADRSSCRRACEDAMTTIQPVRMGGVIGLKLGHEFPAGFAFISLR